MCCGGLGWWGSVSHPFVCLKCFLLPPEKPMVPARSVSPHYSSAEFAQEHVIRQAAAYWSEGI